MSSDPTKATSENTVSAKLDIWFKLEMPGTTLDKAVTIEGGGPGNLGMKIDGELRPDELEATGELLSILRDLRAAARKSGSTFSRNNFITQCCVRWGIRSPH